MENSNSFYKRINIIALLFIISIFVSFCASFISKSLSLKERNVNLMAANIAENVIYNSTTNERSYSYEGISYYVKSYKTKYFNSKGEMVDDSTGEALYNKYMDYKTFLDKGVTPEEYKKLGNEIPEEYTKKDTEIYITNKGISEFDPYEINDKNYMFLVTGSYNNETGEVKFEKVDKADNEDYRDINLDKFESDILSKIKSIYLNMRENTDVKNIRFQYVIDNPELLMSKIENEYNRDATEFSVGIDIIGIGLLSIIITLFLDFSKQISDSGIFAILKVPGEIVLILLLILNLGFFFGIDAFPEVFYNPYIRLILFTIYNFFTALAIYHITNWIKSIFVKKEGSLFKYSVMAMVFGKVTGSIGDIQDEKTLKSARIRIFILYLMFGLLGVVYFTSLGGTGGLVSLMIYTLFITGILLFLLFSINEIGRINIESNKIAKGDYSHKISHRYKYYSSIIDNFNSISCNLDKAVENAVKSERLKTELITNVSHDLKTPLTSILNYSDLLTKDDLKEKEIKEYSKIINDKALRLKTLIEDLFEVSKASSNNITLDKEEIDFKALLNQSMGEWEDNLSEKSITIIANLPEAPVIKSLDGQRMSRVLDNIFSNISKYAMENSRVYIDLKIQKDIYLEIKNISKYPLNISSDELMERFTRGEKSRTTEGSGLGISIAKSLVEAHGGSYKIEIDGDLFKTIIKL